MSFPFGMFLECYTDALAAKPDHERDGWIVSRWPRSPDGNTASVFLSRRVVDRITGDRAARARQCIRIAKTLERLVTRREQLGRTNEV